MSERMDELSQRNTILLEELRRVGGSSALCETVAIASILIDRGLMTAEEYFERVNSTIFTEIQFIRDGKAVYCHEFSPNRRLANDAAIADILIAKGVFTTEEYLEAVNNRMRIEVDTYRKYIADEKGVDPSRIKLA